MFRRRGGDADACRTETRRLLDRLAREGYFERRKEIFPPKQAGLRRIHLQITNECNLACAACPEGCAPDARTRLAGERIRDLIGQALALGATELSLSGGEPLLHPDLESAIRSVADRMAVRVATNGTLVDEAWAVFFAEAPVSLQVGLDGPTAEINDAIRGPGSFARTTEALRRLSRAGAAGRVTLAVALTKRNIEAIDAAIALARTLGIPFLRFLQPRGREPSPALIEALHRRIGSGDPGGTPEILLGRGICAVPFPLSEGRTGAEMWCPVGAGLFIEADGSAYPCARLGRKEFLLGNGLRQSLADILETPAWNGIVRTLYARRNGLETCAACLWNNFCQAGCMGLACDRYGSVWEKDDLCPLRRRAYAGAFEDLLLRPHSVPGGSYGRS